MQGNASKRKQSFPRVGSHNMLALGESALTQNQDIDQVAFPKDDDEEMKEPVS